MLILKPYCNDHDKYTKLCDQIYTVMYYSKLAFLSDNPENKQTLKKKDVGHVKQTRVLNVNGMCNRAIAFTLLIDALT